MPAIFLQGPRGAGKTTLLFRAIRDLGIDCGGFTVKKVIRRGRRVSMDMVDIATGRKEELARFPGPRPVVNLEAFWNVGIPSIRSAMESRQAVVMDELGRFELAAPRFTDTVFQALRSSVPILGVLKDEENWFLDAVRDLASRIVTVTISSREQAKEQFRESLLRIFG